MTAHDIWGAFVGIFIATISAAIAFRCLRSGKSGPRMELPDISGDRETKPKLYWMFQVLYGTIAAMGLSTAILFWTYSSLAVISAMLFFGTSLTIVATATGIYALYGFRSGKALLVYQGVSIFDRDRSPKLYWITQIQNIVMAGFFGAVGVGVTLLAIWFEFSK